MEGDGSRKMNALTGNDTLERVDLLKTRFVGCNWVFTEKYKPMEPSRGIKQDWWLKATLRLSASTTMRQLHRCQDEFY